MKKSLLSLFLCLIVLTGVSNTITITNWGAHYSPADTSINIGDTVNFVLVNTHNVLEVGEQAYDAEENVPLPGGFSLPMGGGQLLPAQLTVGTHYYICTPHISLGMKGKITVLNPSGIAGVPVPHLSLFPNPAKERITIKIPSHLAGSSYLMMDVTGKEVGTGKLEDLETAIQIDRLNAGMYFLQMGLTRRETLRFIKKE
jgi:plastocyanin